MGGGVLGLKQGNPVVASLRGMVGRGAAALVLLGPWVWALAQVPTPGQVDDSQLIKQQQRERALRERQERRPDVRLEGEAPKAAQSLSAQEKPCFPIARFELQGEKASEFQWALQSAITPDDPPASEADGARCLGANKLAGVVLGVRGGLQGSGTQQWGYDVFVGAPLMQPEGFGKRATIAGFSLNWQY